MLAIWYNNCYLLLIFADVKPHLAWIHWPMMLASCIQHLGQAILQELRT